MPTKKGHISSSLHANRTAVSLFYFSNFAFQIAQSLCTWLSGFTGYYSTIWNSMLLLYKYFKANIVNKNIKWQNCKDSSLKLIFEKNWFWSLKTLENKLAWGKAYLFFNLPIQIAKRISYHTKFICHSYRETTCHLLYLLDLFYTRFLCNVLQQNLKAVFGKWSELTIMYIPIFPGTRFNKKSRPYTNISFSQLLIMYWTLWVPRADD